MQRKILSLLIVIFCIFLISCNKSEKEEIKLINHFEYEESLFSKNQDKYLAYTDLYYALIYRNPVYIFDEKYIKEIFDENGKVKKNKEEAIKDLGLKIKNDFNELEAILNKIKLYINEEPNYAFDKKIEALTNITLTLKEKIIFIIEYYDKALYKKDIKKAENFYKEYKNLLDEAILYYEELIHRVYILKERENTASIINILKKYREVFKIDLLIFANITNEFLSLSFSKENLNFSFSETDLEELKEINKKIIDKAATIEATSDKQLDMEKINKFKFRNKIIPSVKEIIDISTEIIELLEKKEDVEKRVYDFETAFLNFSNAISRTVEEDTI